MRRIYIIMVSLLLPLLCYGQQTTLSVEDCRRMA